MNFDLHTDDFVIVKYLYQAAAITDLISISQQKKEKVREKTQSFKILLHYLRLDDFDLSKQRRNKKSSRFENKKENRIIVELTSRSDHIINIRDICNKY